MSERQLKTGKRSIYWSTPKGVTYPMMEEVFTHSEYREFMDSKKGKGIRIRHLMACVIYFSTKINEEYLGATVTEYARKYNATGTSALSLSPQRVGYMLRIMCKYGIVSKRTEKNKSYYRRLI